MIDSKLTKIYGILTFFNLWVIFYDKKEHKIVFLLDVGLMLRLHLCIVIFKHLRYENS